jgi:glucan phosphoethanolaminetransferase (alkaline phosphatase superfamily)
MPQRPISVTVFGILNIGYALWMFVGVLLQVVAMRLNVPGNSALAALNSDPAYRAWSHLSAVVSVVFGLALIASGIGLLLLQKWARILAILYSVLEMIFVVASAVFSQRVMMQAMTAQIHGPPASVMAVVGQISLAVGLVVGLAYPVLLLIFMTRPKIIGAFNSPDSQQIR